VSEKDKDIVRARGLARKQWGCSLALLCLEGLSEEASFGPWKCPGENILSKLNSKCKGPARGWCLVCLGTRWSWVGSVSLDQWRDWCGRGKEERVPSMLQAFSSLWQAPEENRGRRIYFGSVSVHHGKEVLAHMTSRKHRKRYLASWLPHPFPFILVMSSPPHPTQNMVLLTFRTGPPPH
jgi:hypothetical protein